MPHTVQELDTLAILLHDLPIENDGMTVSELDGFVAGLLVCPEMIMTSEWLPVVWGDDVVESFRDEDQLKTTLNAVMDHYNRIAKLLTSVPDDYEALFGVTRSATNHYGNHGSATLNGLCDLGRIAGKTFLMVAMKKQYHQYL